MDAPIHKLTTVGRNLSQKYGSDGLFRSRVTALLVPPVHLRHQTEKQIESGTAWCASLSLRDQRRDLFWATRWASASSAVLSCSRACTATGRGFSIEIYRYRRTVNV